MYSGKQTYMCIVRRLARFVILILSEGGMNKSSCPSMMCSCSNCELFVLEIFSSFVFEIACMCRGAESS